MRKRSTRGLLLPLLSRRANSMASHQRPGSQRGHVCRHVHGRRRAAASAHAFALSTIAIVQSNRHITRREIGVARAPAITQERAGQVAHDLRILAAQNIAHDPFVRHLAPITRQVVDGCESLKVHGAPSEGVKSD
eukprot:scaffold23887_cov138-Isochrysis_galbana.AAC.1